MEQQLWTKSRILTVVVAVCIILLGLYLMYFQPEAWNKMFHNYGGPDSPFVQPP